MNRRSVRSLLFGLLLYALAVPASFAKTNVAVYGFEYPQNLGDAVNTLNASGYAAVPVTLFDIASGLAGFDVLYVTHAYDGGGWSAAACTGLQNFLMSGKGVVLEWDASLLVFTSVAPNIYVNATPQCGFFKGVADRGQSVGFDSPITITDANSPLVAGLVNPFSMGAASNYMYQITGMDGLWRVSATYSGWGIDNNVALMYARYQGTGCVALGTMAFGDNGYSDLLDMSSRRLLLNMISTVAPGEGNCIGAPKPADPAVPASSPVALALLLAMIAISAFLLPRRFFKRRI